MTQRERDLCKRFSERNGDLSAALHLSGYRHADAVHHGGEAVSVAAQPQVCGQRKRSQNSDSRR